MNNPVYNHRLQKWLERNADLQCSNIVSLPDGAGEMATPTASFNAVYQLCHLYHHLFDEGIGLRQIIDYYYVLTTIESSWRTDITEEPSAELKRNLNGKGSPSEFRINSADNISSAELKRNLNGKDFPSEFRINSADNMKFAELKRNLSGTPGRRMEEANTDYSALQQDLKRLGLWSFAGTVMWVLHEVLGLSEDKMIAPMDEKRGRLLLDEILDGGNFGQYGSQQHFGRGTIGHNVQRLRRDLRLVRYYPAEALAEPFFRMWHFFWRFSRR